jgi:hypothetical protein
MSVGAWQTELRRQFGREQDFTLENVGGQPVFSEFQVTNPRSQATYRVAIRGRDPGSNFCSCPDFATNTLGTCKHIEFALARLEQKPGSRAALRRGFEAPFSEVHLHYGARRELRFRPRQDPPVELTRMAESYFVSVHPSPVRVGPGFTPGRTRTGVKPVPTTAGKDEIEAPVNACA